MPTPTRGHGAWHRLQPGPGRFHHIDTQQQGVSRWLQAVKISSTLPLRSKFLLDCLLLLKAVARICRKDETKGGNVGNKNMRVGRWRVVF